jgi:Alr-MurF fusion protein
VQYTINDIAEILSNESIINESSSVIEYLLTDSRRLIFPASTLFFALLTSRKDGAHFVDELYNAGVRSFVVPKSFNATDYSNANFILVDNTLKALQHLAAHHRRQFNMPVIGITGSNGKTIVKEWLYQLLQQDYKIARSPKSYNSQIGVALSVWQLSAEYNLAIFEAGISQKDEMEKLENIIQPTIGILTNIGEAHSSGFESKQEKLTEKWKLFDEAATVICNTDDELIKNIVHDHPVHQIFNWAYSASALQITSVDKGTNQTTIVAIYQNKTISIAIPFTDNASIENAITCWCTMLLLGISTDVVKERMLTLQPVEMRLQLKKAINNCSVINDSYSNDVSSLEIALDFLQKQAGNQQATVILSDLGEAAASEEQYIKVANALAQHKVTKFIGIGSKLLAYQSYFAKLIQRCFFYASVDDFIHHFPFIGFRNELILLKGARVFEFEQIDLLFEQQVHQTVMEVNLSAMVHNLKEYQRYLNPSTKVMAMVKAFSYGSGTAEVASVLQFHKVDYLAVAYADEGVELRKAGITMPIMVMNPETITFQSLVEYNLEPELFSFAILQGFTNYLKQEGIQQFPVHIKIDTGMHRLGFEQDDLTELTRHLSQNKMLAIKSVFSHLVASEDPAHDAFTGEQVEKFLYACTAIKNAIHYSFITHISNSAAIFRHPHFQFDMVRLGIGLYGVDSAAEKQLQLLPVATLRSTIAQIRRVKKGESVGYNRKGVMQKDGKVATIRIGYADGYDRKLGNGVGKVWINGQLAPVIGNVCMDMTMLDITEIDKVAEGDQVEVFGEHIPIHQVAKWCETIPYEIMTSISQRVKRVYYEE